MGTIYRAPQVIQIYRKVAFTGLVSGNNDFTLGQVPFNAHIIQARTVVKTGFNSDGTDFWNVGISAGGLDIAVFQDVSAAGVFDHIATAVGLNPLAADRTVYGRYIAGGSAPTAGELQFMLLAFLQ